MLGISSLIVLGAKVHLGYTERFAESELLGTKLVLLMARDGLMHDLHGQPLGKGGGGFLGRQSTRIEML